MEKGIHCHQSVGMCLNRHLNSLLYSFMPLFSCIYPVVPMKEPVGEVSTHDIIHDKKHEITQEGMMEDMQTSVVI